MKEKINSWKVATIILFLFCILFIFTIMIKGRIRERENIKFICEQQIKEIKMFNENYGKNISINEAFYINMRTGKQGLCSKILK